MEMTFKGNSINNNGNTATMTRPSKFALQLLLIILALASSSVGYVPKSLVTGISRRQHGRMRLPKASYDWKEQGTIGRHSQLYLGGDCEKKHDDDHQDNEPMWWSSLFSTVSSTFLPPEAIKLFSNVSSNLIPAIPEQDDESLAVEIMQPKTYTNIGNHFRLEFILNEFLIGFRYMWRMIPALFVCVFLQDIYCSQLPVDDDFGVKWPRHVFPTDTFNSFRTFFRGNKNLAREYTMDAILWTPVFEELTYRGFGMLAYQAEFMIRLAIFAMLCRESQAVAWLMLPVSKVIFFARRLNYAGFFFFSEFAILGIFAAVNGGDCPTWEGILDDLETKKT